MTYERDIQKTNPVFRNTITPWHENTSTENIESNTEKHLESERDWLSLFCSSFFPLFCFCFFFFVWSTAYETHERQTSTPPKTSEKSSTLLLMKNAVVLQTQTAVEHCRWKIQLNERKSLAFEKDMATVLGSVWPRVHTIYAPRLSNYFIHRMAKNFGQRGK